LVLQIYTIPLLTDNYAYVLHRPGSSDCAIVDPSEGAPVADFLAARGLQLRAILATHHHADHVGGIASLHRPGVEVYGGALDAGRIPCLTRPLDDGQSVAVLGEACQVLHVPGHTRGAIAYFFPVLPALFTGDTLFLSGCGRLFEGTAKQMRRSLQRLAALPKETALYCGHEYTAKNLRFSREVAPTNEAIQQRELNVLHSRQAGVPSVPGRLAEELQVNLFLQTPSVESFAELRRQRDAF
jgi:hydroxyacylglutathione hydrolase